jgi:hypothetical protein
MTYTPVELRHVRVSRSLLGYNRAMVEQMIEEVAESFETTWRERGELADRVESLEKQIVELRRREELLANTLVAAEQAASDVREQARRAADATLAEAQQEARAIIRGAQAQKERLLVESRRIEAMLRAALVMVEEGGPALEDDEVPPVPQPSRLTETPLGSRFGALEERQTAGTSGFAAAAPSPARTSPDAAPASEPPPTPFRAPAPAEPRREPTLLDYGRPGWVEEPGEFKPVSLPPPTEPAEPEEGTEPTSILQRLARGGSRDFDWGE